jgi:hypothetical protein
MSLLRFCLVLFVALVIAPQAGAAPTGPTYQGDAQAIAEVQAVYQRFSAARTWRSRIKSSQGDMMIEYAAPDRFRMTFPGGAGGAFVRIGNDIWMSGGGNCMKNPNMNMRMPNPKEYTQHESGTVIQVTKGGQETIENVAMQTYTIVTTVGQKVTRQKMFVAGGQLRRLEVPSDQGSSAIDYYDYDAPITINPPC